jgi:hypothetical protein
MSKTIRILIQCMFGLILAAGMFYMNYSRRTMLQPDIENNAIANGSYDLMVGGKYSDAISQAEVAISRMPNDALGYHVRALARLKLLGEQGKLDDLSELTKCKSDLKKAQQLTEKEIVKNFCIEFLQKIEVFENRANRK